MSTIGTILVVVLILALVGVLPTWSYASNWGHAPVGIVTVLLICVVVLLLMGKL